MDDELALRKEQNRLLLVGGMLKLSNNRSYLKYPTIEKHEHMSKLLTFRYYCLLGEEQPSSAAFWYVIAQHKDILGCSRQE